MPRTRRKRTPTEQYEIDKKNLNELLSNYSGNSLDEKYEDLLKRKRQMVGGVGSDSYRTLVKDHKKAQRLRTSIRRYEFRNVDTDSSSEEEDEGVSDRVVRASSNNNNNVARDTSTTQQVTNETMQVDSTGRNNDREQLEKCENCHRHQIETRLVDEGILDNFYLLDFVVKKNTDIHKRKFYNMNLSTEAITEYKLCVQCSNHLCGSERVQKKVENMWPAFVWCFLSDRSSLFRYTAQGQGQYLWQFIPTQWRYWWKQSVEEMLNIFYTNITIDTPPAFIVDRTRDFCNFKEDLSAYKLARLRDGCNKHLLPTISCPWGCTDYIHKCEDIMLDVIYQRHLRKSRIKMMNDVDMMKEAVTSRDDYFRNTGDHDIILQNHEWKILPTISLNSAGVPMVNTCRDHGPVKGRGRSMRSRHMVHTCRIPKHNLPCKFPDQLCHVCVVPRTIRPMKRCKYSNSFQMVEQRGTFNGIDTCSVTTHSQFDLLSYIGAENEARAIKYRPDINALLTKKVEEGVISKYIANGRREAAEHMNEGIDFDHYVQGSTYVPLQVCMQMHAESYNGKEIKCNHDADPNETYVNRTCRRYWPVHIFPCQSISQFGTTPPTLESYMFYGDIKYEKLWICVSMFALVEDMWKTLSTRKEYYTSEWYGWLLSYVSEHHFKSYISYKDQRDPFRLFPDDNNPEGLYKKLENCFAQSESSSLHNMFTGINGVKHICFENAQGMNAEINNSTDDIIVVEKYFHNEDEPGSDNLFVITTDTDDEYELRYIGYTWNPTLDTWDGEVFMRHGRNHEKWWQLCRKFDGGGEAFPIQVDTIYLSEDKSYTLCYVKKSNIDMEKHSTDFLRYMGGSNHVICSEHRLPMITSTFRKGKCSRVGCSRKEYYICPQFGCSAVVCKKCYDELPKQSVTEVDPSSENDTTENSESNADEEINPGANEMNVIDGDDDNDSETSSTLMNPVSDEDLLHCNDRNENLFGAIHPDDMDDYLTGGFNPMGDIDIEEDMGEAIGSGDNAVDENVIPTTHAPDIPFVISSLDNRSGYFNDLTISGHVLLNQCGTLLTRKKYNIKGSSRHRFIIERLCATNIGSSIPLLQPEAMLFPSEFYYTVKHEHVVAGALPAALLTDSIERFGFQSLPFHVRNRLTTPFSSTSTNPRYFSHLYDMLANLSCRHQHTNMVVSRGLTVGDDSVGGMKVRNDSDGALLGSVDSSHMVRCLCHAQKFHQSHFFLTLTGSQLKHFGTCFLKKWIDSEGWEKNFKDFCKLTEAEREEIRESLAQASAVTLFRNWQEVCLLFIDYLRKSTSSPFRRVLSIFARNEYQKMRGNLSHIHMMLEIDFSVMNEQEREFIMDIIRGSIGTIVKPEEVQRYIDEGLFQKVEDLDETLEDGLVVLPHRCNSGCVVSSGPNAGDMRCRKINYIKVTTDPTRHVFLPLPNDLPEATKEVLVKIGLLAEIEYIGDTGIEKPLEFEHEYFTPTRHCPPVLTTDDHNISPVVGELFTACRSMQNIQWIGQVGGTNKYICKYLGKIDKQNYVVVSSKSNTNGEMVTRAEFIHNSKVSSSDIFEAAKREAKRDAKRPQGHAIAMFEQLHILLKYPEVVSNLRFVTVPTVALEMRSKVEIRLDRVNGRQTQDAAYVTPEPVTLRKTMFESSEILYRMHSEHEERIVSDLYLSSSSVDRITQFSVRPPELRQVFNLVGDYFRWFYIEEKTKLSGDKLRKAIDLNLCKTAFVDGLQRVVKVRTKAFGEISEYLDKLESNDNVLGDSEREIVSLFRKIISAHESRHNSNSRSRSDREFLKHIDKNVLYLNEDELLPVPVFSLINPTQGYRFLLHVLLSLGRFNTERELLLHADIRECFRHAQLIGESNDPDDLQRYSNELLKRFILEQMVYYSNSRRVIADWMVLAGEVFDSVILRNEMMITDMPSVQLSQIWGKRTEEQRNFIQEERMRVLDAALQEIGVDLSSRLPSKSDILNATKSNPCLYDPCECFERFPNQSDESYLEQSLAVKTCCDAINQYCNVSNLTVPKNVGVRGFPGGGKTFCSMYSMIYAISCGLYVLPTARMAARANQLGGTHFHLFFHLPHESNLTPQRIAECAIQKIENNDVAFHAVSSLDVILADELGQLSAEFVQAIDIILRNIRKSNTMFGGVLLIGTLDHTQIQPWEGRPFLTSPQILPCFKMVKLSNSVRTNNAANQRMQQIARMNYKELQDHPEYIDEFITLASENFTFVDSWDSEEIGPSTFRVYSKRTPVAAALEAFANRVMSTFSEDEYILCKSVDTYKIRNSLADFRDANEDITKNLDKKVKSPSSLMFFKGAVYECTYNKKGSFNQSQPVLMYDLPSRDDVRNFRKIKVLKIPTGWKDYEFDMSKPKSFFEERGFKEISIGLHPNHLIYFERGQIQACRKQYASTMHACMGDTHPSIAACISDTDPDFLVWDKGQLIVVISRIRLPQNTIFVGDKNETLAAFRTLLNRRSQYVDYIEEILDVCTINVDTTQPVERRLTATEFPFRVCDMELPNDSSGVVYLLLSIRDKTFTYIGMTGNII